MPTKTERQEINSCAFCRLGHKLPFKDLVLKISMKMWLITLLMVGLVAGQGQKLDEATEDDIKDLTKDNGLNMKESFRCGLFFAGELGKKPKETLYIIPKLFPADCPAGDDGRLNFKHFCKSIFEKIGKKVNYETPSINATRAAANFNVGDDICGLLKRDHGIINVGAENKSKKFKSGLEIGFYHNSCDKKDWFDTELRMPEGPICCRKAKFKRCEGQKRPNAIV